MYVRKFIKNTLVRHIYTNEVGKVVGSNGQHFIRVHTNFDKEHEEPKVAEWKHANVMLHHDD
jgi:hypothetical protein